MNDSVQLRGDERETLMATTDLIIPEDSPSVDADCYASSGFDITAVTKLKHADLWAAVKKMGTQAALAEHLGIRAEELGQWINLRRCPPAEPVGEKWTEEFFALVEGKLAVLTGKSWEELFPEELRRNAEFLDREKTHEKTVKIQTRALAEYGAAARERLECLAGWRDGDRQHDERAAAVSEAMERLTYREREIVKLRYGLNEEKAAYTLEEVGRIFRVTRERVREIESKALRKLRDMNVDLIQYA